MNALEIVARTIYFEARGEPFLGQVAVACVIRNRKSDSRWPDSYSEVCLQALQFSCWNKWAGINSAPIAEGEISNEGAYKLAQWIAAGVVAGIIPDVTKGANHYLNTYAVTRLPGWARDTSRVTLWPSCKVGVHTFLKL